MRIAVLFCLSFVFASVALAQTNRTYPPVFPEAREEVYKTVDDVQLKLWIWEPAEVALRDQPTDRPAIVFFFGGGWKAGTPAQFQEHCRYLASRGMVAMTADYRVLSRHQTTADRCVADAKSAVRWIRANAKRLRIDPDKVVAGGGSSGGHLAAAAGVIKGGDEAGEDLSISSVPNALALFNPAVLLAPHGDLSLDEDKLKDIAKRTGVPPKAISPIHHLRKGLPPTIIFHGQADEAVPFATVKLFASESNALGNQVDLKAFANAPHGFFNFGRFGNPGEYYSTTLYQLDQFLAQHGYLNGEPTIAIPKSKNVHLRSSFDNSRYKFLKNKKGRVAFIGGSITQMNGYRPMVAKYLQEKFPETEFEFVNAGLSSTCSTTGAMRLKSDVLSQKPDLLFVEFAVNDDQDAMHPARECRRGMEGILRQSLAADPTLDIVVTHFVNPPMLEQLQNSKTPVSSGMHESVAAGYGVASSDLAREIAEQITAKKLDWKTYGGTHPKPAGNRIAANLIADLLDAAWKSPLAVGYELHQHRLPKLMDSNSYFRGRFLPANKVELGDSFRHEIPQWKTIPGSFRNDYAKRKLFVAEKPGATIKTEFNGTAIGAFVLAGPDAGIVEFSVDDEPFQSLDLYHHYSKGLHYPRTVMFQSDLEPGNHTVVLRVSEKSSQFSKGTAVRILELVAN